MDKEEFVSIEEFPSYAISNFGRVIHMGTDLEMTWSRNMNGEITVGMTKDGTQHRRSVKVLVAKTFLDEPQFGWDTPILKDGVRTNLRVDNIVWRPRWFAINYTRQWWDIQPSWNAGPVYDMFTEIVYPSILEASIATGQMAGQIQHSILNQTRVFPSGAIFRFVE